MFVGSVKLAAWQHKMVKLAVLQHENGSQQHDSSANGKVNSMTLRLIKGKSSSMAVLLVVNLAAWQYGCFGLWQSILRKF